MSFIAAMLLQVATGAPDTHSAVEPPPIDAAGRIRMTMGISVLTPVGRIDPNAAMRNYFSEQGVLNWTLTYRALSWLEAGAYAGIGMGGVRGSAKAQCAEFGSSCNSSTFRAGILVTVYPWPHAQWSPWITYGIGWVHNAISGEADALILKYSFSGIEWVRASVGIDYRIWDVARVGPYLEGTVAGYTSRVVATQLTREGQTISRGEPPANGWIGGGVRMVVTF